MTRIRRIAFGVSLACGLALGAAGSPAFAQTGEGGSEPPTPTDSQTTATTTASTPTGVNAGFGGAADLLAPNTASTTPLAATAAALLFGVGTVPALQLRRRLVRS